MDDKFFQVSTFSSSLGYQASGCLRPRRDPTVRSFSPCSLGRSRGRSVFSQSVNADTRSGRRVRADYIAAIPSALTLMARGPDRPCAPMMNSTATTTRTSADRPWAMSPPQQRAAWRVCLRLFALRCRVSRATSNIEHRLSGEPLASTLDK